MSPGVWSWGLKIDCSLNHGYEAAMAVLVRKCSRYTETQVGRKAREQPGRAQSPGSSARNDVRAPESAGRLCAIISQTISLSIPKYSCTILLRRPTIRGHSMSPRPLRAASVRRLAASPTTSRFRTTASIVLRSERNSSLPMPAIYPAILPIDSSMSSTRRRSVLRDLNAARLEDRLHPGTNGAC
jgi:hypothetical protein